MRASIVALALLAGCGVQPTPKSYTGSVKKNFISSCESQGRADGVSNAQDVCACSYAKIESTIKFSEFKKINSDLTDKPKPLSGPLLAIVVDCTRSNESSGVKSAGTTTSKPAATTTTR